MRSASAFSDAAGSYDAGFSALPQTMRARARVLALMTEHFPPGSRILELGCGTGIDALALSERGCTVVATDPAAGMLAVARRRCAGHDDAVSFVRMSAEHTGCFREGSFDGILSDFGGLNCVEDLGPVLADAYFVLRDNGVFLLCLMNRFSFSETVAYLQRARFREAFRRWNARGVYVPVGKHSVLVWYHSLRSIRRLIRGTFSISNVVGLNILTPPPAFTRWYDAHPHLSKALGAVEDAVDAVPLISSLGDHVAIVLTRFE